MDERAISSVVEWQESRGEGLIEGGKCGGGSRKTSGERRDWAAEGDLQDRFDM